MRRDLRLPSLLGPSLAALLLIVGCKGVDEEFAPAFVPKSHPFEGEVDAKYAGKWATTDGASKLDLEEDGTLQIHTVTRSQSGVSTSKVDGKWLVSSGALLFHYGDTTLKYAVSLAGEEMTLVQDGGSMRKVYRRK